MNFKYLDENGKYVTYLPFRKGDIVTVINNGSIYPCYSNAFYHFKGEKLNELYYSYGILNKTTQFKVINIALHEDARMNGVLVYIMDRDFKEAVIGIDGLKLFKQFPLRKEEKKEIKLDRIKNVHL